MDQAVRNKLRGVVTQCRRLLEDSVRDELQGKFGVYAARKDDVQVDDEARMTNLGDEERDARKDILDHFAHIKARGFKPREALDQLVREVAFTHLNRLCAYRMMEARQVYLGDQRFREAVSRGVNSNGVKFYLADHPDDERLFTTGKQDVAYRHFLDWLGRLLSEEIGVLFSPHDPANRLYPAQRVLDEVLALINDEALADIWTQDETIGWVYQYFTPKELRDQARKESQAPRNSYELAFRNQFFTPRYVVEFLTDNTLARIWYEMRKGHTKLKDQCRYMVRRPSEVFLKAGEQPPKDAPEVKDLPPEELLKLPVYIPHRPKKDPRELKILDPACGSGHFLLYCFDLLLTIYEEAYADHDLGPALERDYPTLDALRGDVPRLILAHNLHGIDIDLRASQIAALALWLRCQRAYQDMGLKKDRPKITRSNFVCAEPMPGEQSMLREFVNQIEPKLLGQLVEVVFDKMKLAGEAGSLLKIEEEVRDAVAGARRQWLAGPVSIQRSLFDDDKPVVEQQRFDFSGITDSQFFEHAEAKVVEALRNYAEKAQNGQRLQRRLFTEDTVRGFAFVDLCHKRFDVVLMNPPFGEPSLQAKSLSEAAYPRTKHDLYATFVERGVSVLSHGGLLGAITNRTGFFLSTFQKWREQVLLQQVFPTAFADLGYGVLDTALVETAAYCLGARTLDNHALFFSLLKHEEKGAALLAAIDACRHGSMAPEAYEVDVTRFSEVPKSPFSYWVNEHHRSLFSKLAPLESNGRVVRVGDHPGDGFRFLRLFWEVPVGTNRLDWRPYQTGGEYSPYWYDIHLVADWDSSRQTYRGFHGRVGRQNERPSNYQFFFRRGLTWPRRSTSGFGIRVLPAGCIFADKGPAVLVKEGTELATLGLLFSQSYQQLIEVSLAAGEETQSGTASRSYEVGLLQSLPWPEISETDIALLSEQVRRLVEGVRWKDTWRETTHSFVRPVASLASTLKDAAFRWQRQSEYMWCELLEVAACNEAIVDRLLTIPQAGVQLSSGDARSLLHYSNSDVPDTVSEIYCQSVHDTIRDELDEGGGNRQIAVKSYYVSRHIEVLSQSLKIAPKRIAQEADKLGLLPEGMLLDVAQSLLLYAVGCVLGRWDVRYATTEKPQPKLPDPFDPLPVCPPGMVQGDDSLPLNQAPDGYPLRIDGDGIIVDDPEHSDDIVRRVRQVLEVIWKDRAEAIEKEACEILGAKELRDYFRKPGKGGFWDDHVSRYSKSRRKAPLYWLLQSSKKNYALWLYYQRLDKDLLFKALVNYVEPKIRLEGNRLETLRTQQDAAGGSGRDAKRLGKEVERQEEFLSELRDFEDKLRRAANLHLEPDLNDGVVLNIAPLWELVPWKEAKNYWEELLEGKYEWSSIGKKLRERNLVKG
jgi:hypothetical protein